MPHLIDSLIRLNSPTETKHRKNHEQRMRENRKTRHAHDSPGAQGCRGCPQQQLADYGEASKGFISALEGGHSVPNVDMLITLARAFGVAGELLDAVVDETEKRNAATVKTGLLG